MISVLRSAEGMLPDEPLRALPWWLYLALFLLAPTLTDLGKKLVAALRTPEEKERRAEAKQQAEATRVDSEASRIESMREKARNELLADVRDLRDRVDYLEGRDRDRERRQRQQDRLLHAHARWDRVVVDQFRSLVDRFRDAGFQVPPGELVLPDPPPLWVDDDLPAAEPKP